MKTTLNKTIFALELIKNNVFHHILTYEYSQDNLEFAFARIKEVFYMAQDLVQSKNHCKDHLLCPLY